MGWKSCEEDKVKILILANNDVGLYKFRRALLLELLRKGNKVSPYVAPRIKYYYQLQRFL